MTAPQTWQDPSAWRDQVAQLEARQRLAPTSANGSGPPQAVPPPSAPSIRQADTAFPGLSHQDALAREVPPTQELVTGIIEAGTVGMITGLPETYKSWVGVDTAVAVATGGRVLDRFDVTHAGPVAYWWQDDSTPNELKRIQAYARRHNHTGDLPITWHLNEGLRLPDDIPALRAEIETKSQVLVVLDSLYNFLPGVDLKDEQAAAILSRLKADVCDQTGATIAIVDHAPWPTDANRGQRRAYGSVFKTAAIRWGIYLDRQGQTLHLEAHGNNITGHKRTPVTFDPDALRLRIIDPKPVDHDDLDQRVHAYLVEHPRAITKTIETDVEGRAKTMRESLERLLATGEISNDRPEGTGRGGRAIHWWPTKPSNQATNTSSRPRGTNPENPNTAGSQSDSSSPEPPSAPLGAGVRDEPEDPQLTLPAKPPENDSSRAAATPSKKVGEL
jgi:hypothetical protein